MVTAFTAGRKGRWYLLSIETRRPGHKIMRTAFALMFALMFGSLIGTTLGVGAMLVL